MCGRYLITTSPEAVRKLFGYLEQPNFPPRYNVAPTQPIPIVRVNEGKREFALVRWGLIPAWVKDPKGFSLVINARGESVLDKPAFRNAMKRRRCLIPADGFYEWQKKERIKQPMFIRLKSCEPFGFAGLWEHWNSPEGEEILTCTIITTEANELLKQVHERMPVILPREKEDEWLDPDTEPSRLLELLKPYPSDLMEFYEISRLVNSPANDRPDCIVPI